MECPECETWWALGKDCQLCSRPIPVTEPHDIKPILLSKDTCALIMLFDHSTELWHIFHEVFENWDGPEVSRQAAKEFVSQLKGRWNKHFMMALKAEIEDILKDNP